MASWWRRIKISAVFHASSRRDSRSHAAIRVIRRKTSPKNMTVDHHDRMPRRATLPVRAMDRILGTHRVLEQHTVPIAMAGVLGHHESRVPLSRLVNSRTSMICPC
jgi:hypothetical protein